MQTQCSICYDNISDIYKINSCNHSFCKDCITKWGRENTNTCPCCRAKFNILYDVNNKIVDYFVDKENNQWIDLETYQYGEINMSFTIFYIYIIKKFIYFISFYTIPEKAPMIPYRKSNSGFKYMDMEHYQRELV